MTCVLIISVHDTKEFALERRSHLSSSIRTSASASYSGLFYKVSAKTSASLDTERNEILQSSGASTQGSKAFTSLGLKRLAEVKLVDFDNNYHVVTFNPQFGNLLRTYKDNGYQSNTAKEIFRKYGIFVIERGIFGGFK